MKQPRREGLIESYLARAIGVFALVFSVYFVVSEWDGLVRLVTWLGENLAQAPQAVQALLDYYALLPVGQILPSLGVGAAFGAAASYLVVRSWRSAAIGAVLGAVSSQFLARLTQHCTYSSEASGVEFLLGLAVTAVSTLLLLLPYWTWTKREEQGGAASSKAGFFRAPLLPFVLLTPMVLSLLLFLYYPSLQTLLLSLNSKRFPLPQERFVCLGNYINLAGDPTYGNSLAVSLFVTVLIVAASLSLALMVAVLASQKIRGASIYRTLLIWPFALSPVVTGAIFLAIFREDSAGLINAVIYTLTGTTLQWLRSPELARLAVVAASVWNILGFNILFYIAGLQNIPKDLLEAATIDGANRTQRFGHITFPLLAPYTFFLLVTNVTYAFYGIYGVVDTLTQGGPPLGAAGQNGGATDVLIFKLYEDAFSPGSPAGMAAAQAVILFLMLVGITVLQFRTIESRITYAE